MSDMFQTYESTPGNFDPRTASEDLLRRHGLPPRGDPATQPAFASTWERAFAHPLHFVEAELVDDPTLSARFEQLGHGFDDTAPWAGVVAAGSEPADWIFAQWVVPAVGIVSPEFLTVAFWVGLDGWQMAGNQILQAGIAADTSPFGVSWRAWTEWYPADAKKIDNFPVETGDVVTFFVYGDQSSSGYIYAQNLTKRHGTSVRLAAPSQGLSSAGQTVEWVVEQASGRLPYFSPVIFTDCVAGTDTQLLDVTKGFDLEIEPPSAQEFPPAITRVAREPPTTAVVQWANSELLRYRDNTRDGTGDVHAPDSVGSGGWLHDLFLFSGGAGIIYAVDPAGQLLFYRDGQVNTTSVIGQGGWQVFRLVFADETGILYAVDPAGQLLRYRDHNRDGTGDVSTPEVIGQGWETQLFAFSGGQGIIYVVDADGRLLFHRDDGSDQVSGPSVIGQGGWESFRFVFSGGQGVIYAVDDQGRLLFYRDWNQDGTGDVNTPSVIGLGGWQSFKHLFAGDVLADGAGIIYAVPEALNEPSA